MKNILFLTILLICALGVKAQDADPFSIENATESYTDAESGAVYHYFENYPIQYTIFSNPYETAPGWALTDGLQVKGHLTVPAEINGKPVIAIHPDAFRNMDEGFDVGNTELTGIDLPNSILEVGLGAFLGCTNLSGSVNLTGLKFLHYASFVNCYSLKEVHLGPDLISYLNQGYDPPQEESPIGPCVFAMMTEEGGMEDDVVIPMDIFVPVGKKEAFIAMAGQEGGSLHWYAQNNRIFEEGEAGTQGGGSEEIVDFNEDGEMNVTDVVTLINYIAKNAYTEADKSTLDVNGDGDVNVTDVVTLILMIGKGQ